MAAPTGVVAVGAGVDGGGRVDEDGGGVAADGAGGAAVVGDGELDLERAGGGEAALDLRAFERDAVGEAPAPAGERAVAVGGERGVEGDGVAGADDAVGAGLGGGRLVDADVDLLGAAARGEVAAVVEGDGDREDAGLLEGVRGRPGLPRRCRRRRARWPSGPRRPRRRSRRAATPGQSGGGALRSATGGGVTSTVRVSGDAAVGDAGVVGGGERDPVGAGLGEAVLRLDAARRSRRRRSPRRSR